MADKEPSNLDAVMYQATVVEYCGRSYNATLIPMESPVNEELKFKVPAKCPLSLAAATVARKTNWMMNGKSESLGSEPVPKTPTYPIKNGDLVWIEAEGVVYEHPFVIHVSGKSITSKPAVPWSIDTEGGRQRSAQIGDLINSYSGQASVRIYRHADCSPKEEVTADEDEEVLTDKHLKEDLEDILDS